MWRKKWNDNLGFEDDSPEGIVDDRKSKLEIPHDSIDPTVFKTVSGNQERG